MYDKLLLQEKLKTLGRLAELGGEDRMIDQTLTKLLDYATAKHQRDLEEVEAKLQTLEKQFGMTSARFSEQFQRGELGDDEAFFRWQALLDIHHRLTQRLAILQTDVSA